MLCVVLPCIFQQEVNGAAITGEFYWNRWRASSWKYYILHNLETTVEESVDEETTTELETVTGNYLSRDEWWVLYRCLHIYIYSIFQKRHVVHAISKAIRYWFVRRCFLSNSSALFVLRPVLNHHSKLRHKIIQAWKVKWIHDLTTDIGPTAVTNGLKAKWRSLLVNKDILFFLRTWSFLLIIRWW